MRVDFTYRPLAVHTDFHTSTAYERMLFGAFGSGKTYAIIAEAIAWCLEQPGIRGLIARKTAPELRDTTEPIFKELLPPELWAAGTERRSGGHMESFTFPNGSVVLFRSMDDWNKHRSLNLGFIAYDETNELDRETYMGMASRVRQRDITAEAREKGYSAEVTRRGIWGATNPNGKDWLWRRFVNIESDEYVKGSAWFKSTSLDNPYLPVPFVEQLLNYPEPWIKRYILCQFDDFAGQVFPEWNEDDHVVERLPRPFPQGSVFWMGMDPGSRCPTAGLWVYLDQEKRELIGVAEYEQEYAAVAQHANEWKKIEAQLAHGKVRRRIADPNVNTTERGSNMLLHDMYRRAGYSFELGPRQHKDRIPALQQMIYLQRFKVERGLTRTFECIKNYQWEDLTPAQKTKGADAPERPLKKDDHLVDCAQYIASRWVAPPKLHLPQEDLTPWEWQSREIHKTIAKGRRARRKRRPAHGLGGIAV